MPGTIQNSEDTAVGNKKGQAPLGALILKEKVVAVGAGRLYMTMRSNK